MTKQPRFFSVVRNIFGVSLVSTLVSIGIVAIIGLAFTSLMKDLFGTSQKVNNLAAAEGAVRTVKAVIANPKFCNLSLETGNVPIQIPPPIVGTRTTVDIGRIVINDGASPAVQVIATGDALTRQTNINSITFREFTSDAASRGTVTMDNGDSFRTYLGEIVITFGSTDTVLGGGIGERRIPVCLAARNDGTNRLAYCCDNLQVRKLCDDVGGNYNEANNTCNTDSILRNMNCNSPANPMPLPTQCITQPAGCTRVFFLRSFGAAMNPVCDCVMACNPDGGPPTPIPPIGTPGWTPSGWAGGQPSGPWGGGY